ncbi:MAG TPA: isoleucine--tRNA ligase [Candidatus Kapabacteria bacterium]|nr:isoleucine--tRNA ligase [Candidatus Kapabacteria bacterium]
MYPELRTSTSPNDREHQMLEFWKAHRIFERSIEERDPNNAFTFNEGPPTVNGTPGIHHVISRTLKDTVCRYKTMQGHQIFRKAGWDTHGLPVELAIEKQLGFRHKDQIKEYGVEKFNALCKQSVFDHINRDGGWNEMTERMAYWVNLKDPYITCTNEYIESIWWALKEFYKANLLYKGHKIQPYCPRCETSLSSHEVSLGYDTAKDPSVFVKFKRKSVSEDEYFLAWTTTPWTLISNVALSVHPDVDYVTVINTRKDKKERLILAKPLLGKLEGDFEILSEVKGRELEFAEYEQLFNFVPVEEKAFYVVLGEHVTTEDGTGIVHTAPAFGEEDYQVSRKYNMPIINPLNKSGEFGPEITDFAGQFVKDADPAIIDNLKQRGLLYRKETIEHTYPFCWRCDTPLLYWARSSWYIRVTDYKDEMVRMNKEINWNPPEMGTGRFGNWLEDLKDWGLSRERFWGTPLPLWVCESCEKLKCVGSYDELRDATTVVEGDATPAELLDSGKFDPHKPYVDNYVFACECGGTMKRVPDVIDVWFDSGAMPFAQFHYPFENKEMFEHHFPADYICEAVDQTRGWFYTLHAINTFLFKQPAFKNVIVNDMVLDKQGLKMSKSRGNVVNPFDVINNHGADATRWNFVASSVPWKPKLFNVDDVAEVDRKFFGTLINTYGFFALYANIDSFKYDPKNTVAVKERPEVDRWILSKLNTLIEQCNRDMDDYELTRPARAIQEFVTEQLSNWYVRRNRRRFWKGENNRDKQSAYETLYECLLETLKMMAPFAPFITDWMYQALTTGLGSGAGSVHLELYPKPNTDCIDTKLEARMQSAQTASSLVRQMRERAKIRVRQPLKRVLIPVANRYEIEELRKVEDVIRDEVNVKRVEYVQSGDSDVIKLKAKANFKVLGAKLGKAMKQVAARVQQMSQDELRDFQQTGRATLNVDGQDYELERGDIEIQAEDIEGWLVSSEGGLTVALDTQLSEPLIHEGLAREFVNRIQNIRKDSGFDVTDRIKIEVHGASEVLQRAVSSFSSYICEETLANSLDLASNGSSALDTAVDSDVEIGDEKAKVKVAQVRG